jgi:hypothetical protein
MSQNYDDSKEPKSIRYHSPDFAEVMQMFMGLNDADQGFDHWFLMCENFMRFIPQVLEAIKQGAIKTSLDINKEALEKMTMVWEGGVYLEVVRNPESPEKVDHRQLWYPSDSGFEHGTMPEQKGFNEIIRCPALMGMNPVTQVRDTALLVRIRETVPVPYAFEALDYQQVVIEGHMYYNYKNEQEPHFRSQKDISTSRAMTAVVGRPFFHNMINILKQAFLAYFNIVYINFHMIIQESKVGLEEESTGRIPGTQSFVAALE